MNQERIGSFISKLRREQNITQKELADKIGVSDKTIYKLISEYLKPVSIIVFTFILLLAGLLTSALRSKTIEYSIILYIINH